MYFEGFRLINSALLCPYIVQPIAAADGVVSYGMSRQAGAMLLAVWASLFMLVIWLRSITSYEDTWVQPLHWFESFYRIGSLIYGGGQVRRKPQHCSILRRILSAVITTASLPYSEIPSFWVQFSASRWNNVSKCALKPEDMALLDTC